MDSKSSDTLQWTTEAQTKLKSVPFFARGQAKAQVEQMAREVGQEVVTLELVEQAWAKFGR
jgi:hypothetical protein